MRVEARSWDLRPRLCLKWIDGEKEEGKGGWVDGTEGMKWDGMDGALFL